LLLLRPSPFIRLGWYSASVVYFSRSSGFLFRYFWSARILLPPDPPSCVSLSRRYLLIPFQVRPARSHLSWSVRLWSGTLSERTRIISFCFSPLGRPCHRLVANVQTAFLSCCIFALPVTFSPISLNALSAPIVTTRPFSPF